MPGAIAAYGLVTACREPIAPDVVERALRDLAVATFPGASITVDEASDRGSLVSERPERFAYVSVRRGTHAFSFCRFRGFPGGFEFVFNLSDAERSSEELERQLTARLPLEVQRREVL